MNQARLALMVHNKLFAPIARSIDIPSWAHSGLVKSLRLVSSAPWGGVATLPALPHPF